MAEAGYYMRELAQACDQLHARIECITKACATPLGYTQRGLSSWDQEMLLDWRDEAAKGLKWALSEHEERILQRIEKQVFGG